MSRKHFKAIAAAIAAILDPSDRRRIAEALADVCRESNPRFDRARFLAACGVA
jgi:hypothetical protein